MAETKIPSPTQKKNPTNKQTTKPPKIPTHTPNKTKFNNNNKNMNIRKPTYNSHIIV